MPGRTQAALYAEIDHELSWSEQELPQRERTKHVHSLHPYLGKFVPQVAESLLRRGFAPGALIYDPFAGSGTTLVEGNVLGMDAIGTDVSAFNCLLMRVKTERHDGETLAADLERALAAPPRAERASEWLRTWYAPAALAELQGFRSAIGGAASPETLSVVLSRAARSARLVRHDDLDQPRTPVLAPYHCHKHKRTCRPVGHAAQFLRRYAGDTLQRLADFAGLRSDREVAVLHADARTAELPSGIDGIVTSPPYPGLIDYHEQHRDAYELLELDDRRDLELGTAAGGTSRRAVAEYCDGIVEVLAHARRRLAADARIAIVVNDSRDLYGDIARRSGLQLVQRSARHVNRRTGRRAGEFYEDVLWLRVSRPGLRRSRPAAPPAPAA